LLSRIDDVLDLADAAAARLGLYDIDTILPEAREAAEILHAQASKIEQAVRGLRTLRKGSVAVLEACREIHALENQADTITRRTMAKLFRSGSDVLTVVKWKEIIDLIEAAINRAEDVADVVQGSLSSTRLNQRRGRVDSGEDQASSGPGCPRRADTQIPGAPLG
jgi:uncharacterized protein Yka (UPF0111/DUF47 family)